MSQIDIDATREAGSSEVQVVLVAKASSGGAQTVRATVQAGEVWTHQFDATGLIALVPAETSWVVVSDDSGWSASSQSLARLGGLGLTAVWVEASEAQTLVPRLIWLQPDGSFTDGAATFPHAIVVAGSTAVTVAVDPVANRLWCVGSVGCGGRLSGRVIVGSGTIVSPGLAMEATVLGILPPGGHDPQLTLKVPGAQWASTPIPGDGRIVFLVSARDTVLASETWGVGDIIEKIVYLDANGKKVTVTP